MSSSYIVVDGKYYRIVLRGDEVKLVGPVDVPIPKVEAKTVRAEDLVSEYFQSVPRIERTLENVVDSSVRKYGDESAVNRVDGFYALVSHLFEGKMETRSNSFTERRAIDEYLGTLFPGANIDGDVYPAEVKPFKKLFGFQEGRDTFLGLYSWLDMDDTMLISDWCLLRWVRDGCPTDPDDFLQVARLFTDGVRIGKVVDDGAIETRLYYYPNHERSFTSWVTKMYQGSRNIPTPLVLAMVHYGYGPDKQTLLSSLLRQLSVKDVRDICDGKFQ